MVLWSGRNKNAKQSHLTPMTEEQSVFYFCCSHLLVRNRSHLLRAFSVNINVSVNNPDNPNAFIYCHI